MKKIVYNLMAVVAVMALAACDNGNADVTIIDVAPQIEFEEIELLFNNQPNNITVSVRDGNPGFEQSTLASVTYVITDSDNNEAGTGSVNITGNQLEAAITIEEGFAEGDYTITVTASDSNGNTDSATAEFSVTTGFDSIGIIGDATPGGWGEDTDMTDTGNGVYEITIELTANSAKFRANDAWDVAWGSTDFPSGTGDVTGGSPNIPIPEAGTYVVTFDVKDASYNFERQ